MVERSDRRPNGRDLPTTLYVYAHTVARMNPSQVVGMGERLVRQFLVPRVPFDFDRWYDRKVPNGLELRPSALRENTARLRDALSPETRRAYRERARAAVGGEVTLMNRTFTVASGADVDWYADGFDDLPLLWRLKLYAFEPLEWELLGFDVDDDEATAVRGTFDGWIGDWMETVDIGDQNYLRRTWTPYFVSLRLLNWSRYLALHGDEIDHAGAFARELYKNACFLSNHVENDVGGNHLVDNGAALVAVGLLFDDQGWPWVEAGLSILEDAADRQFLDDGCHYERSPMYHVQTLTRFLTVRDLLTQAGLRVPDSIERTARDGVAFLGFVRPPDGELPLLNDSVHGQTLTLEECLDYARSTGMDVGKGKGVPARPGARRPKDGADVVDRSGLGWLDTETGRMLVDGGPVGPPHLPAHSHSDLLSYLLWLDGSPIVTDTGTFDYERGSRRTYSRGNRGHNTVRVDDVEPIDLAGRYLMGPRPVPTVCWEPGDIDLFEGHYRTRVFRNPAYQHHRAIAAGDRWWLVWDRVGPVGDEVVRSLIHLHPDVSVSRNGSGGVHLHAVGAPSASGETRIHPLGGAQLSVTDGPYFPEFGAEVDRQVLSVETSLSPSTPTGFGYVITSDDTGTPAVEQGERADASTLLVGDTAYDLPRSTLPLEPEPPGGDAGPG